MASQATFKDGLDRISSLPDHIIGQILSLLPIKDAVLTSILSTSWRYLFTSITILDLDFSKHDSLPYVAERNIENFNNFVDKLFYFHQVSLECFRVWELEFPGNLLGLSGWISVLLHRGGVKNIYINCEQPLPSLLFTGRSLVTLKLNFHETEMKIPSKVSLPNLKTLHLLNAVAPDDSVFRLISSCLVLEELDVEFDEFRGNISEINFHNLSLKRLFLHIAIATDKIRNHVIVINAPNVVHFKYTDVIAKGYCLSPMNSLVQADIRVYQYEVARYDMNRECGVTHLLQAVCNAKSLCLEIEQPETVSAEFAMLREPFLAFHELVELEIQNQGDNLNATWHIEFLHCMPNLRKLTLNMVWLSNQVLLFFILFHLTLQENEQKAEIRCKIVLCNGFRSLSFARYHLRVVAVPLQFATEFYPLQNQLQFCCFSYSVTKYCYLLSYIDYSYARRFTFLIQIYFEEARETEIKPCSPKKVPSCLLSSLKEIKIVYFWGDTEQMFEMISYFLQHARYLEKLIVPVVIGVRIARIRLRLLELLPRSSRRKCQVIVSRGETRLFELGLSE